MDLGRDDHKREGFLYSKATLATVDDGVVTPLDGNVTLRVDVVDHTDPNEADEVGFTVLSSKNSRLYYSNRWELVNRTWKTVTQALEKGSLDNF